MKLQRPFLAIVAIQAIAGLLLCNVPLFDLLGYEYCFAITLLTAITSVIIGATPPSPHPPLHRALGHAWLLSVGQLLPGLLFISLNALRVRNCDFAAGLQFFLLLPVTSALYGATLGVACARLTLLRSRTIGTLLLIALILTPLASSLLTLYLHPPIFAWDHLWGYFSGSLYDEGISPNRRLVLFRVATGIRTLAIIAGLFALERRYQWGRGSLALVLVLVVGVYGADRTLGPRWGHNVKRADILSELSVHVKRPGLVLHLPPSLSRETRKQVIEDHEFQLAHLSSQLEISPEVLRDNPIHSFVYKNSRQKEELMGGARTMVAKPWLNEIHIHGASFPHPVLPHELVHALAAHFGSRLLKVSARFEVLVNLTLIEGLAEALSPSASDLDLDHYARAMRGLKMAPDLAGLFAPEGFWKQAPRRAYTIAGSFVQFLIREHGVTKLKEVYPTGNFEEVYQRPIGDLVKEWEDYVDALPLPEKNKTETRARFNQTSIFKRPCAHVIAGLREQARNETPENALPLYQEICGHLGNSTSSKLELARAMLRAEHTEAFQTLSTELLESGNLNSNQRLQLLELTGNEHWRTKDYSQAKAAFTEVAATRLKPDSKRLQWVRLWALEQTPPLNDFMHLYLNKKVPGATAMLELKEFMESHPTDPTLPYLLARLLFNTRSHAKALNYLSTAEPHPFPIIEAERVRLIASSHWNLNQYPKALTHYRRYRDLAPNTGEKSRANLWIKRIQWAEGTLTR